MNSYTNPVVNLRIDVYTDGFWTIEDNDELEVLGDGDNPEELEPTVKKLLRAAHPLSRTFESRLNEGKVKVKSEEFSTPGEAEQAMEHYYGEWSPWGYGTTLTGPHKLENGKYIFTGYRYDSAD
jgi:hypothetical protein